jgi:hypothetical protein
MNGHRRKKTAPNLRRLRAGWGLLFLLYGALAVFLSAGPSLGATQADYALSVAVGPGRAISLRLPDGGKLGRMSAGSYTIYVTDRSRRDNFLTEVFGLKAEDLTFAYEPRPIHSSPPS